MNSETLYVLSSLINSRQQMDLPLSPSATYHQFNKGTQMDLFTLVSGIRTVDLSLETSIGPKDYGKQSVSNLPRPDLTI